ncbi:hypothetical protein [Alteribacillus bidgolensis]|uniref:Uncharacterized protein n=1 Tax=Alteribacillus bidgolensis TaxID=930129 RepID=A0A1G8H1X1_9BACI|nr:hypothetical protein [Alteribacillus bidgolensis]SDI00672.1 hypothetical protein SAMN05216352_10472 [Alteribacillus bidgolensis]
MRYRIISFIVIFSFVSVMVYLHHENSHYAGADDHSHEAVEVPDGEAVPAIDGELRKDDRNHRLLILDVENFTFTPEKIGSEKGSFYEGHAHLYVNGEKKSRIYSTYHDAGKLEKGDVVQVFLTTNHHKMLQRNGQVIFYEERIEKE